MAEGPRSAWPSRRVTLFCLARCDRFHDVSLRLSSFRRDSARSSPIGFCFLGSSGGAALFSSSSPSLPGVLVRFVATSAATFSIERCPIAAVSVESLQVDNERA